MFSIRRRKLSKNNIVSNAVSSRSSSCPTSTTSRSSSSRNVSKTHRRQFLFPILLALSSLGGEGTVADVAAIVSETMSSTLNKVDKEQVFSGSKAGEPRWRNTMRWAKDSLMRFGLLDDSAPRGVWRLSDLGYEFLEVTQ